MKYLLALFLIVSANVNAAIWEHDNGIYGYYQSEAFQSLFGTVFPTRYDNAVYIFGGCDLMGCSIAVTPRPDTMVYIPHIGEWRWRPEYIDWSWFEGSLSRNLYVVPRYDLTVMVTTYIKNSITGLNFSQTVAMSLLDVEGYKFETTDVIPDNPDMIAGFDIKIISPVPVPAAAFLFAPALLGFMGLRRKAKQA